MQTENQVQQCTNCNKPFPSDKIDLHEAYCCRNIRRCQQCQSMIDIKDMDDHIKQQHSKRPCELCLQQFQPSQLSKHELICPRRAILCQYCQNKYAYIQFTRHEQMCGARTKSCSLCQRLVSLKDLSSHQSRCNNRRNQQRRQQRNQVSQDSYIPRQRQQAQRVDRQRQNSTNNLRQPINRSNSIQNNIIPPPPKPAKIKPANIIGPQTIKPSLDPIPISIRIALKQKQQRMPLKNKN